MVEQDIISGLDFSSLSSVTQEQVLQAINQATTLSTKAILIVMAGGGGTVHPDVTNNPRYTRYLWFDTTSKVLKYYGGVGGSDLYADWLSIGAASSALSIVTNNFATPVSDLNGLPINLLKRVANGQADNTYANWLVRLDSAGQYCEICSVETALSSVPGGVPLARISLNNGDINPQTGVGPGKYLGYTNGKLQYRYLDPSIDLAKINDRDNRVPPTSIAPGTANYFLKTDGVTCFWSAVVTDNTGDKVRVPALDTTKDRLLVDGAVNFHPAEYGDIPMVDGSGNAIWQPLISNVNHSFIASNGNVIIIGQSTETFMVFNSLAVQFPGLNVYTDVDGSIHIDSVGVYLITASVMFGTSEDIQWLSLVEGMTTPTTDLSTVLASQMVTNSDRNYPGGIGLSRDTAANITHVLYVKEPTILSVRWATFTGSAADSVKINSAKLGIVRLSGLPGN